MTAERIARIEHELHQALAAERIEVIDDSARHIGHAGARDGRGHFKVLIVAEAFRGQAPLARHRQVYAALADLMQTDIHALNIKALTPDEWHATAA